MRRELLVGCACIFVIVGCGGSREVTWTYSFSDASIRDGARLLEASILRDGCDGSSLYSSQFQVTGSAMQVPTLESGRYGFRVRARNADCEWFATGCAEVELSDRAASVNTEVAGLAMADPACPIAACREGLCAGETLDGGTGCRGCVDDEGNCHSGDNSARCGTAGARCMECGCSGDTCTDGSCVPARPITAVAAGTDHTCAIADGRLYCWGDVEHAQLGDGQPNSSRALPTRVGLSTDWTAVDAETTSLCGLRGGELVCWGDNWAGQSAQGLDPNPVATPQRVSGPWQAVAVGSSAHCALAEGEGAGTISCWGYNQHGNIDPTTAPAPVLSPREVSAAPGFRQISAGEIHVCGIDANADLYCWGWNRAGGIGNGEISTAVLSPFQLPRAVSTGWRSVAAAQSYTCGVDAEGGLRCWGCNIDACTDCVPSGPLDCAGRLGASSSANQLEPPDPILNDVLSVSAWVHGCAIVEPDALFCWGDNDNGQVGQPMSRSVTPPMQVPGQWFAVDVGGAANLEDRAVSGHTCAIATGGALYCWGDNRRSQLGQPSSDAVQRSSSPLRVCLPAD